MGYLFLRDHTAVFINLQRIFCEKNPLLKQNENSNDEEEQNDEETPPRRTKKAKRSVDPPKKEKKAAGGKKGGLSQLLGKRKSAAEASERIRSVTQQETGSGHNSDKEERDTKTPPVVIPGERQSSRLRNKGGPSKTKEVVAESASRLKEQRNSLESQGSNARNKRRRAVDEELLVSF